MKNISILLFTCLLLVLTSCEKEAFVPQENTSNNSAGMLVSPNYSFTNTVAQTGNVEESDELELCAAFPELAESDADPFIIAVLTNGSTFVRIDNPCYEGSMQEVVSVVWKVKTYEPGPSPAAKFITQNYVYNTNALSLPDNENILFYNVTLEVKYENEEIASLSFTAMQNGNFNGNIEIEEFSAPLCPSCGGSAIASIILPVKE